MVLQEREVQIGICYIWLPCRTTPWKYPEGMGAAEYKASENWEDDGDFVNRNNKDMCCQGVYLYCLTFSVIVLILAYYFQSHHQWNLLIVLRWERQIGLVLFYLKYAFYRKITYTIKMFSWDMHRWRKTLNDF